MIACPVNAYEKDPVTGIVKHLDDQCFGCQYCTMACPYEVPKYHPGKGIVRKCDMCSSRLAVGEPPACVQACPHQAISIRVVDQEQVVDDAEASVFLPGAPDPQITLPTTTYKSRQAFPRNLLPADYFRVNPQHAHWPLVVMLVLTQLSVGAFSVGLIMEYWFSGQLLGSLHVLHAVSALGFGVLALGSQHASFRSALVCVSCCPRTAPFVAQSRDCSVRGVCRFGSAVLWCDLRRTSYARNECCRRRKSVLDPLARLECSRIRLVAVFCSTMIYVFTQRECWSFARVGIRFALTSALLGVAAVWLSILAIALVSPSATLFALVHECGPVLCWTLLALTTTKLAWEGAILRHLWPRKMTPLKRSALLMMGDLSNVTLARFALGLLGGAILPTMLAADAAKLSDGAGLIQFVVVTGLMFSACLAGELLERYLFFAACAAPQMPGGIR